MTSVDHILRLALLIVAVSFIVVALSGCQSTSYRVGADGLKYHVGDTWTMHRLDKNYTPHRVR